MIFIDLVIIILTVLAIFYCWSAIRYIQQLSVNKDELYRITEDVTSLNDELKQELDDLQQKSKLLNQELASAMSEATALLKELSATKTKVSAKDLYPLPADAAQSTTMIELEETSSIKPRFTTYASYYDTLKRVRYKQ